MSGRTWTIGQVARRFALARSTLLHYDAIGLLSPKARTDSNYRLYGEADLAKLEKIRQYREAGLSLDSIAQVLARNGGGLVSALERRLFAINQEIQGLRDQQALILRLLDSQTASLAAPLVDKTMWVAMLRAAGLDESGMMRWHREFERFAPDAHQEFLESLGIGPEEIRSIRVWSNNDGNIGVDHAGYSTRDS
jgi:MerR family transcriptional regulator, thiopeptide resistance regulator